MLSVHFIRHAESLANAGGVTGVPADIPLTPKGVTQAHAISHTIEAAPQLILSSPYLRARETTKPTLARFPDVPYETWPVHEIAMLATAKRIDTSSDDRRPLIQDYWSKGDPDYIDGPGAESFRDFVGRIRAALKRLSGLDMNGDIVIFSHEQFMKAVILEVAEPMRPVDAAAMRKFSAFHLAKPIENADGFSIFRQGDRWLPLRDWTALTQEQEQSTLRPTS